MISVHLPIMRLSWTKSGVVCVVIIFFYLVCSICGVREVGHEVDKEVLNSKLKSSFAEATIKDDGSIATEGLMLYPQGNNIRLTSGSRGLKISTEAIQSNDKTAAQISPLRQGGPQSLLSHVGRATGDVDSSSVALDRRRVLQAKQDNVSCPLEFQSMREFPWFVHSCENQFTPENSSNCCTALLYALGQSESQHLNLAGEFRVKDQATFGACMNSLAVELDAEGASNALIVPTCFPQSDYFKYVSDPSNCQGIITRSDFERVVGSADIASLDSACSGSLANVQPCQSCITVVKSVINKLNYLSPNSTDCSVYTLLYAGGISNSEGPYAAGTANCIFSVTVNLPVESGGSLARDLGIGAAAAFAAFLIAVVVFCIWWRRKRGAVHRRFIERNDRNLKSSLRPNTGLIKYNFDELKAATKNFSSKNYIGSGGFGDVYKGVLKDGLEVAVKRMKNCSEEKDTEFVNEVDVINRVRHKNLVVLRGCCVGSTPTDGHQRLLVYDYMPNGNLHDYLFGKDKPVLTWPQRRRMAIDIAKGIAYLHNATRPAIIHRDIKSANVLLDENLNARVADFGLAKFTIEGQTHVSTTNFAGTMGYVAPEYVLYNQVNEKSDVYSFGVVLLELISGNRALEASNDQLPNSGFTLITDWARARVKEGSLIDVVDERIKNSGPRGIMENIVRIALLCCHQLVIFRPSMEQALHCLESDGPMPRSSGGSLTVSEQLDVNDLLYSGFSNYEYSRTGSTISTSLSTSEFSGGSVDVSSSELLR